MSGVFISFTMYASSHIVTGFVPVSKYMSSGTYCVVEDRLVTWFILICCPSFGFSMGSNFASNFDDTNVILDPESIIIDAVGPLIELSLIVALEGCAPRKVVLGSLPVTGLSWIALGVRVLASECPSPLVSCSLLVRLMALVADCGMSDSATLAEHLPGCFPATGTPLGCFHSLFVSRQMRHHPDN